MPGNEVGERIHNFFGQESLSQGQHHSQVVDRWPGLNNNHWVGSQRQIGGPLLSSNLKSYSVQPSADSERGHGGQSSNEQHGLNFTQSGLKPEIARSHSQNQQPTLNGYMHGYQEIRTRQNESNFLGVDTEYNRDNLTSRGLQILDSQLGNGPELNKKNSGLTESTESPVNYDFFGGRQPMRVQHSSILQPLPRQQSGIDDMQLLHQEVMMKKLQELHRQQQLHNPQFQQQEARQLSSINQVSSAAKQATGGHTPAFINGLPMQDASNYSWQSELMEVNTNWLQCGASPVMQGSSSRLMFSPDQGQVRVMGLVPQQVDQSLYGVPVSGTRINPSQYSSIQMDKPTVQQISASRNSFPGNQYTAFSDQAGMQDGTMVSMQSYRKKNMFGSAAEAGLNSELENLQQMNTQQRSTLMQEFCERQRLVCPSETSQGKTAMQATPSQNVATLDPEEEKILFGSDDSIWDPFGRSTNIGSGCSNMLNCTEAFGAFPSLQSGSWSALMQSAVAETFSGAEGVQEGWSGLSDRIIEPLAATQQPTCVNDGSKHPSSWVDNNLQAVSAVNSGPFSLSGDANMSVNYSSVLATSQSGLNASHDQSEKLQNDSSQKSIQQSSGEGIKWLDRSPVQNPVAEGSHFYSLDEELRAKGISVPWMQPENMSSYNTSDQKCNRPNGWNFIDSISPGGVATLKDHSNDNSLQRTRSNDHKSDTFMPEKMSHSTGFFMTDSVSSAIEHSNSAIGQQVNREDSNLINNAVTLDSIMANQNSSHRFPNSHNLNLWKKVGSSASHMEGEVLGKHQHHLDKSSQNIESSGNHGLNNGGIGHEMENCNTKEKSSDSYHSNISHRTTSGFRENVWLDGSDSRALPGGKQKSSSHIGRKPFGTRKFQYHPMGNVDIDTEPSYGIKNVTHSQAMPQQASQELTGSDQMYFGQTKYFGHNSKNSMENEKGHLPGFQGDSKYLDEAPSKSMHPGYVPVASAPIDKSVGNYASNKTTPSSQNMLELLHKVDQLKEHSHATHFRSSDYNQSQMPETEISDGSVDRLKQNQSSVSQGFGLQLGPPSQRLSILENTSSSQSSSKAVNSLSSTCVTSDMGKKSHTWLASTASVQMFHPSHKPSLGDSGNNISITSGQTGNKSLQYNTKGNFATGLPYHRSHLHTQQQTIGIGGQVTSSQSVKQISDTSEKTQASQAALASVTESKDLPHSELTSAAETSQLSSINQNHGGLAQQFPVLEAMPVPHPYIAPGMSQQGAFLKMLPNACTGDSNQQISSVSQAPPYLYKTHLQYTKNLERSFSGPEKLDDQIAQNRDDVASGFAAYSTKPQGFVQIEQQVSSDNDVTQKIMSASHLQGKERLSDTTFANSTTQRDIEAFGRFLKPNNMLHQNYSLLHQMLAMKSTEIDPDNRSMKRFKGPDSGLNASHVAHVEGQQLPASISLPPGDSRVLGFSPKTGDNCGTDASPNDTLAFNRNNSQSSTSGNGAVGVRDENTQISLLMAPSWFDQYESFKNGQMLSMYNAWKSAAAKTMEQPFTVGKPSDNLDVVQSMYVCAVPDARQLGNVQQSSIPMSVASEHLSSQFSPPVTTDQNLVHVRLKKSISATSERVPWHKEVMQGFAKLQNISMAEAEWAQAANRLMEKVEDETELIEDRQSVLRSKRRLILTTQLMQQLLHPQPRVLSSDASSYYESMAYVVSRSTLGDACSSISSSKSDAPLHLDSGKLLFEKLKAFERIDNQYISETMEVFADRARELEDELLRLDKGVSILDLRVECQDLEKFSVINRFAKFHGRAQAEGAEASLSSDANAQKFCPQRYVTALPIPRNLPDSVQCLSL